MKTLRADLAAASREARDSGRSSFSQERDDDPRVQARIRLHEAENAISEFRADLRAELRREVVAGRLPEATVDPAQGTTRRGAAGDRREPARLSRRVTRSAGERDRKVQVLDAIGEGGVVVAGVQAARVHPAVDALALADRRPRCRP